jgi:clan AA aspartic protease (TIGR02281 family)
MLGLGIHRHASPWAISAAATVLVFGPPLAIAAANRKHRLERFGASLLVWPAFLWLALPVYFPGERNNAVATGIALIGGGQRWDDMARAVADGLPAEPVLARPEVPQAAVMAQEVLPPAAPLTADQIALPYEGQGRRLSVPVVFEHRDTTREVFMMLDTGATYTTLSTEMLESLGVIVTSDDPEIVLHTANGERTAKIVLIDRVWLGDLAIDGIAIATCDECASSDTVGLLGLNVANGFNLTIDADRREVVFNTRKTHNRQLDIKQFSELDASFTRYPGGRIEVEATLRNDSDRVISMVRAAIHCGPHTWTVDILNIGPGETGRASQRLPEHDGCDSYQIALEKALW